MEIKECITVAIPYDKIPEEFKLELIRSKLTSFEYPTYSQDEIESMLSRHFNREIKISAVDFHIMYPETSTGYPESDYPACTLPAFYVGERSAAYEEGMSKEEWEKEYEYELSNTVHLQDLMLEFEEDKALAKCFVEELEKHNIPAHYFFDFDTKLFRSYDISRADVGLASYLDLHRA